MSEYQCTAMLWSSPVDAERCERPRVIELAPGKWYCAICGQGLTGNPVTAVSFDEAES